ncbi:MAG TPA: nucleotidyltransferase family protein [Ktedonobacterales bacterium]|nr:nucleotidyltransferase family protein [Ktedonobacterales bacterium]
MLTHESIDTIHSRIAPILKRHGVAHAAVFGSFARGTATSDSDLDVLVEFAKPASLLDMAALKLELEDALGRPVDVVTPGGLIPGIRDEVMREQVVVL